MASNGANGGHGNSTTFAALTANRGRPYATLNARGAQSPVTRTKNYAGTMVGNGSLGRRALNGNGVVTGSNANGGNATHYILSSETEEAKNSALATHV